MHPDEAGWTLTNMLLAAIADALRWLQWAKTPDGKRNRNRPKPIQRPGVEKPNRTHPKVKGVPASRMRELLGTDKRDSGESKAARLKKLFQTGKG